jgi:hypothetical protein
MYKYKFRFKNLSLISSTVLQTLFEFRYIFISVSFLQYSIEATPGIGVMGFTTRSKVATSGTQKVPEATSVVKVMTTGQMKQSYSDNMNLWKRTLGLH